MRRDDSQSGAPRRRKLGLQCKRANRFPAKYGRHGFRRNFPFGGQWRGRQYGTKQIEAYVVEDNGWLVISFIIKYF